MPLLKSEVNPGLLNFCSEKSTKALRRSSIDKEKNQEVRNSPPQAPKGLFWAPVKRIPEWRCKKEN